MSPVSPQAWVRMVPVADLTMYQVPFDGRQTARSVLPSLS
jgi:hypothetical protein